MRNIDDKRHIILLTDCLAGFSGGSERQIYELASRLNKNKYRITIASLECEGEAPTAAVQAIGCELKIFRVKRIYGRSGFMEGLRFRRYLKDEKADIVMTYHFSSDIWGTIWGRLSGVPVIISNRRDMGFWRNQWHVKTYQLINPYVDRIIVVADAVRQKFMREEKIPPAKIKMIYNGVELPAGNQANAMSPLRTQLDIAANQRIVMHVANLKPIKGHRYLIQAFAELLSKFPQCVLVLVGEDKLDGALQKLAKDLGAEKQVIFLGKRDDVAELLAIADICVLPSLSEGMSNAILEYMAYGKPVVATSVGGNPEIVQDGYSGYLVEKENTEGLKNALFGLLQNPEQCVRMGANGLKRAKEIFSMTEMLNNYERTFDTFFSEDIFVVDSSMGAV